MLFKDYVAGLNELLKERPELWEVKAVYASDDEGNSFYEAHCNWTPWFYYEDEKEFGEEYENQIIKPNAVCVN